MLIHTLNPANGKIIKTFEEYSSTDILRIIESAYNQFNKWKEVPFSEKNIFMKRVSEILRYKKNEYGKILTLEMGKTITQAEAEVEKCAWVCDYYAENAEKILSNEFIPTDASESYIRFDPLGIILAIMPWNFPFWQVFRFAAPALMAGNVALLKHASNVPMCALAIEDIFKQAGFPEYIFTTLLIGSRKIEEVISHQYVKVHISIV